MGIGILNISLRRSWQLKIQLILNTRDSSSGLLETDWTDPGKLWFNSGERFFIVLIWSFGNLPYDAW